MTQNCFQEDRLTVAMTPTLLSYNLKYLEHPHKLEINLQQHTGLW